MNRKRIIRSRGYGKTYDLIKYALDNDCAILCASYAQKNHHLNMAMRYFNKEPRIYTFEEWNHGKGLSNQKYVVDELELVAQWLIGGQMMGWSMSIE